MHMLKLTAAAALVAASLSASAMSSINDDELSTVSGQDGVSIAANLNINIGSFQWGNNADAAGKAAAVSFDNISVSGLVAMTIDVISGTQFNAIYGGATQGLSATNTTPVTNLTSGTNLLTGAAFADQTSTFYNGKSDVVQFAFPNISVASNAELMNISVKNITLGTNGASASSTANGSFGSFAINQLDLRGTTVWMWAH